VQERLLREEAATMARRALLERAEQGLEHRGLRPAQQGWVGGGGLRLTAAQCEVIARYLRESAAAQAQLRLRMAELAREVGGRLTVLDDVRVGVADHSVKELGSLMRKVATELRKVGRPDASGDELLRVLSAQADTVRYTIVLPEASYVKKARKLADRLYRRAVAPGPWDNSWTGPRYRGINTSWTDITTGVRFEVQLHTPATREASRRTHLAYEEWRLPGTAPDRVARLEAIIGREFRRAPLPPGVEKLTRSGVRPSALRRPLTAPPELGAVLVDGGLLISLRSLSAVGLGTAPGPAAGSWQESLSTSDRRPSPARDRSDSGAQVRR
jgi:hypothetical protein